MGAELAQWREWNHDGELEWEALGDARHEGMQRWVRDLNGIYQAEPSLWEVDFDAKGFKWIDANDSDNSVISFIRFADDETDHTVGIVNFTPIAREGYRVGVPSAGAYREVLNSDAEVYGGSNVGNFGRIACADAPSHGFPYALELTIPPLGFLLLKPE
jgi:1,4-alpha-glucan branching enzyme